MLQKSIKFKPKAYRWVFSQQNATSSVSGLNTFLVLTHRLYIYNFTQTFSNLKLSRFIFTKTSILRYGLSPLIVSSNYNFDCLVENLARQCFSPFLKSSQYKPGFLINFKYSQVAVKIGINRNRPMFFKLPDIIFIICYNYSKISNTFLKELRSLNIPIFGIGYTATRVSYEYLQIKSRSFLFINFFCYFLFSTFIRNVK